MNASSTKRSTQSGTHLLLRSDRLWLRWAVAVLAADLVIHLGMGLLVNDLEGWAVAAGTFLFVLVSGLLIVG